MKVDTLLLCGSCMWLAVIQISYAQKSGDSQSGSAGAPSGAGAAGAPAGAGAAGVPAGAPATGKGPAGVPSSGGTAGGAAGVPSGGAAGVPSGGGVAAPPASAGAAGASSGSAAGAPAAGKGTTVAPGVSAVGATSAYAASGTVDCTRSTFMLNAMKSCGVTDPDADETPAQKICIMKKTRQLTGANRVDPQAALKVFLGYKLSPVAKAAFTTNIPNCPTDVAVDWYDCVTDITHMYCGTH